MNRNPIFFYKSLVIGIIFLLIGVGLQPAFAIDTKNSIIGNIREECRDCRELNKTELVKVNRLLNEVEVHSKFLLILSKNTPEIKTDIEELSENITKLKEELAYETSLTIICVIFERIYNMSKVIYLFFEELSYELGPYFHFGFFLVCMCLVISKIIKFNIFFIGQLLSCWEWPGEPTGSLIIKILDTKGGNPQDGVTAEIKNGTLTTATNTLANGKAYFLFTPYKDYDVNVNFIFAETVEFYQPKLEVTYYLDELMEYRSENL